MTRRSLYGTPAVRVQVLLTEEQVAQIAGLARGRGTTSAQWLRETVIAELRAPDIAKHLQFLVDAASTEPGMQIYIGHITAAKQLLDRLRS